MPGDERFRESAGICAEAPVEELRVAPFTSTSDLAPAVIPSARPGAAPPAGGADPTKG